MPRVTGDARSAATCGTCRGRKRIGTARVGGGDVRPNRPSTAQPIALDHSGTASLGGRAVIQRPPGVGTFQFVVIATLRAAQLMRGCRPKVDGVHKATVIAQLEVSAGKVMQVFNMPSA